jgi:hypothetical protein
MCGKNGAIRDFGFSGLHKHDDQTQRDRPVARSGHACLQTVAKNACFMLPVG